MMETVDQIANWINTYLGSDLVIYTMIGLLTVGLTCFTAISVYRSLKNRKWNVEILMGCAYLFILFCLLTGVITKA